jgi:Methyltransferase domain
MSMAADISARVEALDLRLFDAIQTQSVPEDRRSWLAIQRAVRRKGYVYLEIGSYLGGSLQQHLVDPHCRRLYSIDDRPLYSPDARGQAIKYRVATEDMLRNLGQLGPLDRLVTFESDARAVDRARITEAPTFCFIDGQHTAEAVRSDFSFCMAVCDPNAAIAFHDAPLLMPTLRRILADLRRRRVPFVTRKVFSAATFVVFLRDCPARSDPFFVEQAEDGSTWLRREPWRLKAQAFIRAVHPMVSRIVPPFARGIASSVVRRLVRDR